VGGFGRQFIPPLQLGKRDLEILAKNKMAARRIPTAGERTP
jgi:hypothetical protein